MKNLATVKKTAEIYAGVFNESSLRWLILKKDVNGFGQCIRRAGGKILIDLDAFDKWIDSSEKGNINEKESV